MNLTLSQAVNSKVRKVSKAFGIKKEDVLKNAIAFYLDNLSPYLDLKEESKRWDRLSDEALLKFEQSL